MVITGLDPQFISLFLDTLQSTFTEVLTCDVAKGGISAWRNQLGENDVAVMTGISGNTYNGVVVYSMKQNTAARMIRHLDPTIQHPTPRDVLSDGLGEIVNILSGSTMTKFSEAKMPIAITTPSVVIGDAFEMFLLNQTTLSADYMSQFGLIEVNIAIKKVELN